MANSKDFYNNNDWRHGHLHAIDNLPNGDSRVGQALYTYAHHVDINRQSRHWKRTVTWIENILFGLGRHYIDDILISRLSRDTTTGESAIARETQRSIPRPTTDLIPRYVETNISVFNENQPRPRVTPKSDRRDDIRAAEISELTIEFMWEALKMPAKHRELKRLLLYTGIAWMEVCYDPLEPRHMNTAPSKEEDFTVMPGTEGAVKVPFNRRIPLTEDERKKTQRKGEVQYGDITAKIISGFEMHLPVAHDWDGDEMGWIMREYYTPIDVLKDKLLHPGVRHVTSKKNGWHLDRFPQVGGYNVQNLPLWWWERLTDVVEGPGPSIYVGTPEQWSGYTVVRILDRKPSPKWPRGRTIITAGDQVIYDSPKKIGARAYDPRWPHRWHPYIRYIDEPQPGSIYGRSMVAKLLPKMKRVDAIDTTMIMYRRTVPIAGWLMPKGASPVEDFFDGRPGAMIEYDPRRTAGAEPKPIFAPSYPQSIVEERNTQIAEMEAIAGTEEVLRGQRPTGVNSAMMLDALRRQALASKSSALQYWDESLQDVGAALLIETKKNIGEDDRYAERLRVLAREKHSRLAIDKFAGDDLSDNVNVRIDTAAMAMVSKEAQTQRAMEFLQYAPNLMQLPLSLREAIVDKIGLAADLRPQSADVNRVKDMIQWIKDEEFERVVPFEDDDPYVFHELLVNEKKQESFYSMSEESQTKLLEIIDIYKDWVEMLERQKLQMQQELAKMGAAIGGEGGGS